MAESSELLQTQTCVEWKIKNFWNISTEVDVPLMSPDFHFADIAWNLAIYPNGTENSEGWIELSLYKTWADKELCVDVRIGIKHYDGTVLKAASEVHKFEMVDHAQVYLEFITRSALKASNAVSSDGTITIFCSVAVVEGSLVPANNEVACRTSSPPTTGTMEAASQTLYSDDIPNLSKDLKDLYLSKGFTDVTIKVKSKEFSAHISILSARSAVFASMFQHDTEEKKCGRVEIPDLEPDTFEYFLLFLYTGKLDGVTSSNAVNLYLISDKYDVQELKEICVQRMTDTLTVDSFCDVLHLAVMHNESELLKTTSGFFINNARQIMISQKWHAFISENPLLCNELLLKSFF